MAESSRLAAGRRLLSSPPECLAVAGRSPPPDSITRLRSDGAAAKIENAAELKAENFPAFALRKLRTLHAIEVSVRQDRRRGRVSEDVPGIAGQAR